ncbi:MAG: hypothetical protein ACFFCZ_19590 [Promethearchaeota archaeon]
MTVNEIYQKHHTVALQIYEKDTKDKFAFYQIRKPQEKKKTTIYRYVKELKDHGLVAEAGRRVKEGQSFNEILYSRTSLYFCRDRTKMPYYWDKTVRTIALALQYYLQKQEVDFEKFHLLITDVNKAIGRSYFNAHKRLTDSSLINVLYNEFSIEQRGVFIGNFELVEWFITLKNKEGLREQILDCFK